jgi:O-antigen/teichoic acid export membrane protein
MSEKRQFIYHTLVFGFGGILAQLVPFILFPLYTNYLRPTEYGILDMIQRSAELINTVLMIGGIRLAVLTFYRQAKDEEERRKVAVTISLLLWLSVVCAIFLASVFSHRIDVFLKIGDPKLLAFGLATALLESLVIVPMTLTQARLESVRYVLTNLSMLLTRLGLCIYFVAWLEMGIYGVLLSQCWVSVVFSLLLMLRELRIGSVHPDMTRWGEVLRFCWPFVPTGIIWFFYLNSDRYFITHWGPYESSDIALAAVGLYALAFRLVRFTEYVGFVPMRQVWSAQMYDVYNAPDAKDRFGAFTLRIITTHLFFVLGVCIFAPELIRIVCDSSYFQAASLIPVVGICSCLNVFAGQAESIFYITKKTYYKPINNAVVLPCIIGLMYLLVPQYGIMGAAIAITSATLINCIVIYFITQRLFAVRYPFRQLAILLGLSVFCYWGSILLGTGIDASSLTGEEFKAMTKWDKLADACDRIRYIPFLWKASCVLLWLGLIWVSGTLLKEDKEMFAQTFRKILAKFSR